MNRNEWITNFDTDKRIMFNMALDFFSRSNNRNKCKMVESIRHIYDSKKKDGTVPTEAEYNLLINNKYFQRFYKLITSPSRYELGDMVFTAAYSIVHGKKSKFVAVVVDKRLDPHYGWVYDLQVMAQMGHFYNSSIIYSLPQKKIFPVAGRNLNKVVK